jgi:predicted transcriptional regulator
MAPNTVPLTARIPADLVSRLRALAKAEERSVSYLVHEAILQYLDQEEWIVAEIQAAIAEAEAPDAVFYSSEEVFAEMRQLIEDARTARSSAEHDDAALEVDTVIAP